MDAAGILGDLGKVLGGAVAVLGFLKVAAKVVFKPLKSHFEKIDHIYKEVTPNGGGSLKDAITELKGTVARIERRQRTWLSYEENGVFETDGEGRFTWANRSLLHFLNAAFEEVEGNGWKNFVHPDGRERVFREWEEAVRDGRDFKGNVFFRDTLGRKVCLSCEVLAVKEPTLGTFSGYVGYVVKRDDLASCFEE
jgi:PAS domain-containing protein